MIDPGTLERLEAAGIIAAHEAAITARDEPRAEATRRAVRAFLVYLEHNRLVAVVDPAGWPEWLESPEATP